MDCECDLAVIDKIATRAATCATATLKFTSKFTGHGMRDDMTLYQPNITKIDSETKNVLKLMDANEKQWRKSQNELIILKMIRKMHTTRKGIYMSR